MTEQVDNWHKLARYDTNMQGELHANLLRNNGIEVSLQVLSAIPGLNSGIVLWVQEANLAEANAILDSIDTSRHDGVNGHHDNIKNDDSSDMNESDIINNQGGSE